MWEEGFWAMVSGVPVATMWPPFSPASGPRSMTQSARLIDVEVVFDDENGVAAVNEAVEDFDENADVVKVQARGGFVEEVKRFARGGSRQFGCEFDALCLAAREGCGRLTEAEITQAHVGE